jgi:hypothetical protein
MSYTMLSRGRKERRALRKSASAQDGWGRRQYITSTKKPKGRNARLGRARRKERRTKREEQREEKEQEAGKRTHIPLASVEFAHAAMPKRRV